MLSAPELLAVHGAGSQGAALWSVVLTGVFGVTCYKIEGLAGSTGLWDISRCVFFLLPSPDPFQSRAGEPKAVSAVLSCVCRRAEARVFVPSSVLRLLGAGVCGHLCQMIWL